MRSRLVLLFTALSILAACDGNGPSGGGETATLVVVVTASDGLAVVGADVEVDPGDRTAQTDAQGEARFANLSAGDYTVIVRTGVGEPTSRSVTLREPFTSEVRVTVALTSPVLRIEGPTSAVDWGAPEVLSATLVGPGDAGGVEWVSLDDLYLGAPVVLGRGATATTSALKPGRTRVEARLRNTSGGILARATIEIEVRYRVSWNMDLLGSVPYPDGTVGDVWVEGNHAYVARRRAGGVSIVDLVGIQEVGRYTAPALATGDLIASPGVVYFTHEGPVQDGYPFGVTVLDVTNPAAPQLLGGIPRAELPSVHTVWLENEILSAAVPVSASRMFHLYDVSDPAAPRALSTIAASNARAHDSHSRNGIFFGAYLPLAPGETGELVVASITDPANPAVLARLNWTGGFQHSAWLSADGRYLYEADEIVNAPIRIFDVANPAAPVLVATYQPRLGTVPHHFQVRDGGLAFLAHYKNGVEVLDVSDPVHPRLVGFYDTHPGVAADTESTSNPYEGVWGVHWTDDGKIAASDMNQGLFVFRFRG